MNLTDLHKAIVEKQNRHLYIFFGEEIFVRDTYINHIQAEFSKEEIVRCDTVEMAVTLMQKTRLKGGCKVFVVSDDKTYVKDEKAWEKVNKAILNGSDILILTLNKVDKRSKFYKHYTDYMCEFEKLSDDILYKYIKRDTQLSDEHILKLIDVCSSNYNKIRLEQDKIIQLAERKKVTQNDSFEMLLESGVISQDIGDITFKFTDSIIEHNLALCNKYLIQSKLIKEPEMLTLSVLYNNFKQMFQVQTTPKNVKDISKLLALTPWQIKLAREKQCLYNVDDLMYILKMIQKVEQGVKTGTIDSDIAVDYLLINIL